MKSPWLRLIAIACVGVALGLAGCGSSGSDGAPGDQGPIGPEGPEGPEGPPGGTVVDLTTAPPSYLEQLEIVSEITSVEIASPPVVTFTLTTDLGTPIVGLVPYWDDSNRFVRFTITKLVPGTNGEPNSWVAYVRDGGEPDYDTGASLVDNGDGSYTFTFLTDVATVAEAAYEPSLTHRVAGQIGASSAPFDPMNLWYDFVPAGGAVTTTRNIAVMETCNECHDDLVFHGRRFEVEYCVQCHNPDLATGEGNMSYMIHRIHNAGTFAILDDAIDYSEVTYPQDVENCRKCHNGADAETPDGDNWKNVPNMAACDGCHGVFETGTHTGGAQGDNSLCAMCHSPAKIEEYHTLPNATPNNPELKPNQRDITYELIEATVDGSNLATVRFKILSDGTPLDATSLPADLAAGNRYPGLLFAYAMPQGGLLEPMDYNNLGRKSAQPLSVGIDDMDSLAFDGGTGELTATLQDAFPAGATLRAVGLQGYFRQDTDGDTAYDTSLHTPSAVVAVTGDDERRDVVDSTKCAQCHEWFEGHGGNRVYNMQICTLCHVPNLSSSGRQMDLAYPEDAQNLKDLIHGIHSSSFRTRDFEHVRIRGGNPYEYNWSEVTFPRGASTANCLLCHKDGSFELPLMAGLLPTTVRTTTANDGMDADTGAADAAFTTLPNPEDWVNTPTSSTCFYCHTSEDARAHMILNGGLLSVPETGPFTQRAGLGAALESCSVCHGPGKIADLEVVHADD